MGISIHVGHNDNLMNGEQTHRYESSLPQESKMGIRSLLKKGIWCMLCNNCCKWCNLWKKTFPHRPCHKEFVLFYSLIIFIFIHFFLYKSSLCIP